MGSIKAFILLVIILSFAQNNLYAQLSYAEGGPSVEDPGLEVDIELRRYVDATNGNDSNDGKTQATAWQTLGKVSSERSTFGPGFHILLKRGGTWNGGLDFQKHSGGSEGKNIVLGAYGDLGKSRPKISGYVTLKNYFMARDLEATKFMFINGHHSIIYNNICHGSPSNSIAAIGECHHTVIMGNLIYDTALNDCITLHSADWFGDGKDYWVQSHHWVIDNICIGREGTEDGVDLAMGNYTRDGLPMEGDVKIIANRIQMTSVPGLSESTGKGVHGIVLSYDGQYHWIVGNTVRGGRGMGTTIRELQKDIKVNGNIVFRGDEMEAVGLLSIRIGFENNTVYDYYGFATPVLLGASGLTFTKNIVLRPDNGGYWAQKMKSPIAMDYNWWGHSDSPIIDGKSFSEWQTTTGYDLNSSAGAVPGLTEPADDAYNHDPRNWRDQAFLDQFIPSSDFVGLDGIIPGAYNKNGNRQGMVILPFENSYLDNGGLGWEGPPMIQQRLRELGISWGEPLLAKYPSPKDKATNVLINSTLSWSPGDSTISHDIYLGVKADSLIFQLNQNDTLFTPSTLAYETTYYWRVDQVTSSGTHEGVLWLFSTEEKPLPPTLAENPSPTDGELEVRTNLLFSWELGKRTRSSNVYFGKTNPPSLVTTITENSFNPGTLDLNTKYYWKIDGVNEWGTTDGTVWEFTTQAVPSLPEGWASLDIGKVGISGDDSFEDNSFRVTSSGSGIKENADQFRFVYHELSGNGEIIARVVSVDNTSSTAMAGAMIREKLDSTSAHSMSAITPESGIKAQWRSFDSGGTKSKSGSVVNAPYWVKLVRASNYLVSYESADGQTWKSLKTEEIKMQSDVQIGLVVTSGDNDSLCTALFDNVSINGEPVSVEDEENKSIIPKEFAIGNYPNPFNPTTTIRYDLPESGVVKIRIYDIMGSLIAELVNSKQTAGSHSVEWSGKNSRGVQTASGIYLYRVEFNDKIKTAKMLLMK